MYNLTKTWFTVADRDNIKYMFYIHLHLLYIISQIKDDYLIIWAGVCGGCLGGGTTGFTCDNILFHCSAFFPQE